ncbi:MAG: M3 family metallopeptidase [Gemmatimonadetes bacterium]|nr:M3 family metallopeptidase [Gemmatimonadota bacterium]
MTPPKPRSDSDNPLLTRTFAVPFDRIKAEHVEPGIDALLADAQDRIDAIAGDTGERTYDNTLGALERATERLEWASGIVSHLESVATYPELRSAYQAIQPKLSAFWSSVLLNERLWKALQILAQGSVASALRGVRKRHLQKVVEEFRRQGAELDTAGKERVAAINVELAELTTTFAEHVLDATNAFELVVEDEARLAGLPDSAKESARASAEEKGSTGWRFTLQAPSVHPVLTYLDDASLRETVWRASNRRAAGGDFDNGPLITRILELRREKAVLLGYVDFSDLVLEDRMAGTGTVAAEFVGDLREKTVKYVERENTCLEAFRAETNTQPGTMRPWDVGYYAEKQRAALYDFDEEKLRPYFPVDHVLEGLAETVRQLYGIQVTPATDLPVWDKDVRTYKLLDADGTHLASYYVDLYPRENKRPGAWMDSLMLNAPAGPHLGLICANVNPPVGDKPALLTHREVETLFHEFGHLMHHCLSRVTVRSLGGTNVAWDFVELPSQIMENWCWEREALDLFARHYETGQPIPGDLFTSMTRTRAYRAANSQMRQLGYAAVDLALHRTYDPATDGEVTEYVRRMLQPFSPVELPEDFGFITSFLHLFANAVGYAAGYYSYKWAEVLEADAFTRFRDEGVFGQSVGRDFREQILALGDSKPPGELYRAFMGREPRLEPLLERQGLTEPVSS